MFRNALILTVLSFFSGLVSAQEVFFFPQIADGTISGLTLKTEFIFVNTGEDTLVTLEFLDGSGNPLELELGELGRASSFQLQLGRGQSTSQETPGTGDAQGTIVVGYARVTAGAGVGGTAVFTTIDANSGIVQSEAGVPATKPLSSFTLFVDTLGNTDTGLAMVQVPPPAGNGVIPSTQAEREPELVLALYDTSFDPVFGDMIATTNIVLDDGHHLPRSVFQFFNANPEVVARAQEMQGSLTVNVGGGRSVAAVTLRQRIVPDEVSTLTTFPVVPGSADAVEHLASFSVVAEGQLLVDVQPPASKTVLGAIYRVYSGSTELGKFVRSVEGTGSIQELLPLPELAAAEAVSRVEIRLIFSSGETSPVITVTP